jgi:hypothetical protein
MKLFKSTSSVSHRSHTSNNIFRTLLLLFNLEQECSVDVRKNTSEGDRRANEGIQFVVSTDGKLQVAWCDTLDLQVFCGVSSKFENFGSEVFQDGGDVDSSFGADAHLVLGGSLQETLYATARKLWRAVSVDG